MDPLLKQRMVGASVLVALAVIVIPAWLEQDAVAPAPVVQRDMAPMPTTEFPAAPATLDPLVAQEIASGLESSADDLASRISPLAPDNPPLAPLAADAPAVVTVNAADVEKIQLLPRPVVATPVKPSARPDPSKDWVLQLGSFASKENADSLHAKLRKAGFEAFVAPIEARGKRSYRVRLGGTSNRQEAERLHARLTRELGYSGMVVKGD